MKDIFTDLYNKVLGFFRQTERKEENAKDVACNRLRVVLMQDRTNLTPELLERMRQELIELLSKYVEMDKEALELNFEQDGNQMALMLSIPVLRAKEESEIKTSEEENKSQEEEKIKEEDEETETSEEEKETSETINEKKVLKSNLEESSEKNKDEEAENSKSEV